MNEILSATSVLLHGQRSGGQRHTQRLSSPGMTYPCDRVSSSYIVTTEDLTWQQTQSAEPLCDEAAKQEKQTEAVCLGWTVDPGTPVIQVFFFLFFFSENHH